MLLKEREKCVMAHTYIIHKHLQDTREQECLISDWSVLWNGVIDHCIQDPVSALVL